MSASNLAGLNFALSLIGLLVSGSVLISFLIHHRGHWNIQEKLGPFILVLFTFLWPLFLGFSYMTVVVHGSFTGFWCQYFGVVVICAVGGTLTGHILLALERYYKVLHNQALTTARIVTCFGVIYGYLAVALLVQWRFAPYGFFPMESGTWCYFDMTSLHPIQRAINILIILYCVGAVSFISFVYFSVYLKTREVANMRRQSATGAHRSTVTRRLEKRVFYRCLLISGAFSTFFTPIFIGIFYRFFSGNGLSPEVDFVTSVFVLLDSIVTPILVCYMQPEFKEAVLAYLPKRWRLALQEYFEREASLVRCSGTKASAIESASHSVVTHRVSERESLSE